MKKFAAEARRAFVGQGGREEGLAAAKAAHEKELARGGGNAEGGRQSERRGSMRKELSAAKAEMKKFAAEAKELSSVGADAKRSLLPPRQRTEELAAAKAETEKAAGKASDAATLRKELSAAKAEMKKLPQRRRRAFVGQGGREEEAQPPRQRTRSWPRPRRKRRRRPAKRATRRRGAVGCQGRDENLPRRRRRSFRRSGRTRRRSLLPPRRRKELAAAGAETRRRPASERRGSAEEGAVAANRDENLPQSEEGLQPQRRSTAKKWQLPEGNKGSLGFDRPAYR